MENQPNYYTHLTTPGLLELLNEVDIELIQAFEQYEALRQMESIVMGVIRGRDGE